MDSSVLGMGAVAWSDAWNAATPDAVLRLPVDAARLLELLRGLPVSRALLTDLQRAAAAGHTVDLLVSSDRQVAEIATGSGHYVLTVPARNAVLDALIGRSSPEPASPRSTAAPQADRPGSTPEASTPLRQPPAPGVLWQPPSAFTRGQAQSEPLALPWLGPGAYLEVDPNASGTASADGGSDTAVRCARLHLQLPRLGRFDADIRVCGSTVAVLVDCADHAAVQPRLAELQLGLTTQGLISAHVGLGPREP
jgi:hypothetical protein